MCVCVCVFILFHLLVSSGCTTSVTYVRCSDQRSCGEYYQGLLPSSFISVSELIIFHLQRPKLQPATTGGKTNDITMTFEKMIHIDIGYKSPLHILTSDENILKTKRLL